MLYAATGFMFAQNMENYMPDVAGGIGKKMKKSYIFSPKIILALFALMLLFFGEAAASFLPAANLYREGKKCLSKNDNHRAYLLFREIAREYPSSEYADDAHFIIANYYLDQRDYFQAENEFRTLINEYPDSPYVKDAKSYFTKVRSRFLDDKVVSAISKGDYKTAKIYLDEMLAIDPSNQDAASKLKEVDNILSKTDLQRRQLEEEKKKLEEQGNSIRTAQAEVAKMREEAEKALKKAEELNQQASGEYNSMLQEAKKKEKDLQDQITNLENDLKEWRERARKYEAQQLAGKGKVTDTATVASSDIKILFEGVHPDPAPEPKESIAKDVLKNNSPSIVLVSERTNDETKIMKVELVLDLDLQRKWSLQHYLKFRVDYTSLLKEEKQKPTIIYYTPADMDEVNSANSAYRKKIIVAIDKNKVEGYSVSAFFVRKE
jgi:tetratricopeptide (TPR) repeat protein